MVNNYHYFYVLKCSDNSFYAGYTSNLLKRLSCHNSKKGAKYTRSRIPVVLYYFEIYFSKREAMQREYWFKQLSREKKKQYMRGELR